ncbi:mutant sensor protein, partial [Lactobacillus acidophilus]|nr:mutant sensor protein [Lactobacillus acidophilus]
NSLFHSFKYDINDLRSYLITISMIYNPKSLILFSTIKFNIIKTLYFFMTFLNTDKMKLVACMTLLTVIFQVITVIISWLITKRDELLWNKRTVKEYFIVLLLSVVIIGTAAVNLYIVGFILVILSFGISALSDFNRILLNNSFISFISFVVITSYSNENAVMILDVFISVIVALYICEWIVADIGYLKTMSNDETSAVKNAFDSILGTGLLGSIIWLIFILIKRLI